MGMLYLSIYAVVVLLVFAYSIVARRSFIYKALWFAFLVSAIFCIICKANQDVLVGHSTLHDTWYDLSDTTLRGYLLIVVCAYIAFIPIDRIGKNKSIGKLGKTNVEKFFLTIFCWFFLLAFLTYILTSFDVIKEALLNNDYLSVRESAYDNSDNEAVNILYSNLQVGTFCFKFCWLMKYFVAFLPFVLLKEKKHRFLASLTLLSDFALVYIYGNINAARGSVLIFAFFVFLIFALFYKYFAKKTRQIIIKSGIALGVFLGAFFISVTISRTSDNTSGGNLVLKNICFYLGHGPIEFSKIVGSLSNFSYGQVVLGRLSNHYFGTPYDVDSILSSINYPNIGPVFVSFLAWIYTDFGTFGCLAFFSIWSYVISRLVSRRHVKLSSIFVFCYYLSYFVTGIFTIGRLEYASLVTTSLVGVVIFCFESMFYEKYMPYNSDMHRPKSPKSSRSSNIRAITSSQKSFNDASSSSSLSLPGRRDENASKANLC